MEVLNTNHQVIFLARIQEISRQTVRLVSAEEESIPPLFYNAPITLRGYLSDEKTVLFQGLVRGSSQKYLLVGELQGQIKPGRAFFRQAVSAPAKVACPHRISDAGEHSTSRTQTVDCTILDISGGGVRIACTEEYREGDWLAISEAYFPPVSGVFSFSCEVLRAEQKGKQYIYGCRFEKLAQRDQDRLIETIFLLQREEMRQKQMRMAR